MQNFKLKSLTLCLILAQSALAQQPAAPPAAPPPPPAPVDLAPLQAAQQRLEAAAREVAELSMQQGGPAMGRVRGMRMGASGRAIIGVQLAPQSGKEGARVDGVSPGGPAAEAGLKAGDLIVSINGNDLRGKDNGSRELTLQMAKVSADAKVRLTVQRAGKVQDFELVARRAPGMMMGSIPGVRGMPMAGPMGSFLEAFIPGGGGVAGLELATLTPKLGQYFGADKGVLVLKAPADNQLKLEEGDVILAIDAREPSSASHATRILRSYQPGEKVSLRIQRQRKTQTLEGVVPERRAHFNPGMRMGDLEESDDADGDTEVTVDGDGRRVEKRRVIIRDAAKT